MVTAAARHSQAQHLAVAKQSAKCLPSEEGNGALLTEPHVPGVVGYVTPPPKETALLSGRATHPGVLLTKGMGLLPLDHTTSLQSSTWPQEEGWMDE